MTLLTRFVKGEADIEALYRELDMLSTARDMATSLQTAVQALDTPQAQHDTLQLGFTLISQRLGFESADMMFNEFDVERLEIGMESIRELPGRIYRTIADLINELIKKAKALYRLIVDKLTDNTVKVSSGMDKLEARIAENESTIAMFSLEPGVKLSDADREKIEQAGREIILDTQGRILNKVMIESDLTLLIPSEYRGGTEMLRALVMGNKWGDVTVGIKGALEWSTLLLSKIDRTPYTDLIDALMTISSEKDITDILEVKLPAIEALDKSQIESLPVRGKDFKSARPLIGDIYPTFLVERAGGVRMSTLVYSYTEQRLTMQPTQKLPKGLPEMSLSRANEVRELIARLSTVRTQYSNALTTHLDQLEKLGANDHRKLATAGELVLQYETPRNGNEIKEVQALQKSLPKLHRMATTYLDATERYLRTLIATLNAYLVLIAGKS